jgi:large subunit ribosomal protein L24
MAAKIKKGDTVIVLTGRDKGREGEVTSVSPKEGRAVVKGVNVHKRHQKPSQTQQGGIFEKELPIDLSNLALKDPTDGKPTRVGFKMIGEGEAAKKVRYSKRSGEVLDV